MTDQELLRDYVQRQSNEAMCELVRRHIDMVHATALRELRDPSLADDATQAVFLVLIRRAKELSARTLLAGWLFKTTLYAVADIRKQRSRREHHEREAAAMKTAAHSGDGHAISEGVDPVLGDAIGALPAADREAIIIRYFQGRPTADVAIALGISENTARQRVARAMERLRTRLNRKGVALSAAAIGTTLESSKADAAANALTSQVEAMIRGTVPAHHIQLLVTGVLQMISHAQKVAALTMGATMIAACLLVAGGIHLMSSDAANVVPSAVAEVPAFADQDPADAKKAVIDRLAKLHNLHVDYDEATTQNPPQALLDAVTAKNQALGGLHIMVSTGTATQQCHVTLLDGLLRYEMELTGESLAKAKKGDYPEPLREISILEKSRIETLREENDDGHKTELTGEILKLDTPDGPEPNIEFALGLSDGDWVVDTKRINSMDVAFGANGTFSLEGKSAGGSIYRCTFDPKNGNTLVKSEIFHPGEKRPFIEVVNEDFKLVDGVPLPMKSTYTNYGPDGDRKSFLRQWKIDVRSYQLNDPKNHSENYVMKWPLHTLVMDVRSTRTINITENDRALTEEELKPTPEDEARAAALKRAQESNQLRIAPITIPKLP